MNNLAVTFTLIEVQFLAAAVVFLRVSAMILVLPGLGERMIPTRIKLVSAFALTSILTPLLPNFQVPQELTVQIVISEISIGVTFGVVLRFMTHILLIAGTIAAQATSLAQLFGAPQAEPSSAIGTALHLAGLTLLMTSGFHTSVIELLKQSWDIFPVGFILPGQDLVEWSIGRASDAFRLAFMLSMPFILVSVIYNLVLGVINKAMPQLMVALVGAPAITGLSLVTFSLSAVLILTIWLNHVAATLNNPFTP